MSRAVQLHVRRSGHGEPLVLLHGWGMNLQVFEELRACLEAHHTVIAFDLPGHGRSPWGGNGDGASELDRIAAAIPRGASLLGWSLGGQLALELAPRCAPRRLVLMASTPRFVRGADWSGGLAPEALQRFTAALEADPTAATDEFLDLAARGSPRALAIRARLQRALELGGRAQATAMHWGLKLLRHNDLRQQARRIAVPLLVICGRHDAVMPAAGPALAALVPGARLLELPRAGHTPFLSHTEEVGRAVLQFLDPRAQESSP